MENQLTKRVVLTVLQPCILCENTLYESALWRDDQSGEEEWSNTPAPPHLCPPMRALIEERRDTRPR